MKGRKLFALGIDGACWDYIDPLIETGEVPVLASLIERGSRRTIKSTLPHISAVAWSAFMTGKGPSHNGVFDWCIRRKGKTSFRPVNAADRVGRAFWHYLSEQGLRVGVYNLPLTFPPERVNGFFISGFDSPSDGIRKVMPQSLHESLVSRFGSGFLTPPSKRLVRTTEGQKQYAEEYIRHIEVQTDVMLDLISSEEIDVIINNYMIVDHLNHRVKDNSLIEKSIVAVDRCIGRIVERYPDANYIIFSDHGSNRVEKTFFIFNWLESNGFIVFHPRRLEELRLNALLQQILVENLGFLGVKEKLLRHVVLLPLRLMPRSLLRRMTDSLAQVVKGVWYWPADAIDITRSSVLYCSVGCQGFYLNVKTESNPEGIIEDQTTYTAVRNRLVEGLASLRTAQDYPLYDHVFVKEDFAGAEFQDRAPDVVAHPDQPFFLCPASIVGGERDIAKAFLGDDSLTGIYGQHIDDGIGIFSGHDFQKSADDDPLWIWDLAAYILYLSGVSIPDDFDGILRDTTLIEPSFLQDHAFSRQASRHDAGGQSAATISRDDEDQIADELKNLGYM